MNQFKTSVQHEKNTESGLSVVWASSNEADRNDDEFSVVCYSDGSRWLFDNSSGEEIALLGEVSDGLNRAEILQTNIGTIVALYSEGIQTFLDRDAWLESLAGSDKAEAKKLIASV